MSDTLAESLNDALGKLVLTNVEVLNLVEGLEVLEKRGNSGFILNRVALESETDEVGSCRDHLGELEGGLSVENLVLDLNLLGLCTNRLGIRWWFGCYGTLHLLAFAGAFLALLIF